MGGDPVAARVQAQRVPPRQLVRGHYGAARGAQQRGGLGRLACPGARRVGDRRPRPRRGARGAVGGADPHSSGRAGDVEDRAGAGGTRGQRVDDGGRAPDVPRVDGSRSRVGMRKPPLIAGWWRGGLSQTGPDQGPLEVRLNDPLAETPPGPAITGGYYIGPRSLAENPGY